MNMYKTKTNNDLITLINDIYVKHQLVAKFSLQTVLKHNYSDLYNEICYRTSFLDKYDKSKPDSKNGKISLFERLYCINHNLHDRPKCQSCHVNPVNRFNVQTNCYGKWCCPSCQAHDPECVLKSKQTRKQKYGDEHFVNIEKSAQTRKAKYGGKWHNDDFGKKVKHTKLLNHGSETYVNSTKAKQTIQQHIKDNPDFWYDRELKNKQTKIANGHDPNWNNRTQFKKTMSSRTIEEKKKSDDLRKQTMLERYGVEFPQQSPEIHRQTEQTNIRRYGYACTLNIECNRQKTIEIRKQHAWNTIMSQTSCTPLFSQHDFINNRIANKIWKWKCNECGTEFESKWDDGRHSPCPKCSPPKFYVQQTDLFKYVNTLIQSDWIMNDRATLSGSELDIVSKTLKFAIEYDGLFWHTYESNGVFGKKNTCSKPIRYHLNKTEACEKIGVHLMHITSDEWLNKNRLCKAMIRRALGVRLNFKTDYEYDITQEDSDIASRFFDKYEIHGKYNATTYYALRYKNHIVAMMSFKKLSSATYDWQLCQYAMINNFDFEDAFSKLFDYFVKNNAPTTVKWIVDRRFYNKQYEQNGFQLVAETDPNFYWVNKYATEKHSSTAFSPSNIDMQDQTKSFLDNMYLLGFSRYFDCGNLVFAKTIK